jgi:2-oxoglutarate ferredoxin oxidoreductase subunit alpha
MTKSTSNMIFIDGSLLIIEAMARAGAGAYIGYPITPVNRLFDGAKRRIPIALEAPDEITALQWSAGFSSTGTFPVTASAFPGFALMIESLNMSFMMELPMVIILAQRLGPSTGSATTGGQGDLLLLRGCISGGYPLPVLCPSNLTDCWDMAAAAVKTSTNLRTPVILLTSKEMIMTNRNMDISKLSEVPRAERSLYHGADEYQPYAVNGNMVPDFLPVGNDRHQVRSNASTHDTTGATQKNSPEALENTARLKDKIEQRLDEYTFYEHDEDKAADTVILTYGISAEAARDAVRGLRTQGEKISLLVMKTMLPVPSDIFEILDRYPRILIVEENLPGLLRELLFGQQKSERIQCINKIGNMITPLEIIEGVEACKQPS